MADTEDGERGGAQSLLLLLLLERLLSKTSAEDSKGEEGVAVVVSVTSEAHSCNMFINTGAGRLSRPVFFLPPASSSSFCGAVK